MAIDPRKRQKKLAKERAKRKAKVVSVRQAKQGRSSFAKRALAGLQFELAARGPIHECYVSEGLTSRMFERGLGYVVVSRHAANDMIAAGVYLIDVYCLGVKDAFVRMIPRAEWRGFLSQVQREMALNKVEPAYAKKLVEDAVAYARGLGLEPHTDFRLAWKLLAEIDASACAAEFTFGERGKPHYISGPYDSQARISQIREALERSCGAGAYNFTIMLGDPFGGSFFGGDDGDEDYDSDDDDDK